jgi:hypothetical protein
MGLRKGFTFFGDLNRIYGRGEPKEGRIVGSFPQWYFTRQNAEFANDLKVAESKLKGAMSPLGDKQSAVVLAGHVSKLREYLKDVKEGRPEAKDDEITFLKEFYAEGEKRIHDESYTDEDDKRHLVDPHTQLMKNTTPYIPVGKYGDVFKACNILPIKGRVTLTQFTMSWKIVARYLNLNSNTMYLQKADTGGKPMADHESDYYQYLRNHGAG